MPEPARAHVAAWPALRAWRAFLRPVPDEALVEAHHYLRQGLRVGTVAMVVAFIVLFVALVASGTVNPLRQAVVSGAATAAMLLIRRASFAHAGREHPEVLMLLVGLAIVASSIAQPWAALDTTHAVQPLVFAVIVLIAAFTPWAPRYTILLGIATGLSQLALGALYPSTTHLGPAMIVGLATMATVFGVAISQVQRRMWASLHRTAEQAGAAYRLSSIGRIAEGLAHSARTPLAATMNDLVAAQLLLDELDRSFDHPSVTPADLRAIVAELRGCTASSIEGMNRVATLVGSLRGHAFELRDRPIVAFAVNDALRMVGARFAELDRPVIRIEPGSDQAVAHGDPDTLGRILHSLVENAVQAILESGVGSRVRVGVTESLARVVVWVDDDGPGVPEDLLSRVFEPMVTTRRHPSAVGLGLPIARDLVESVFGGELELVRMQPGARFEVSLPRERGGGRVLLGEAHRPVLSSAPGATALSRVSVSLPVDSGPGLPAT